MTKQLIRVGHSPDPDDAFMFYALAHNKLDTGNLEFRHELQDIETLNRRALRGELEVTAVSIHAYAHLLDKYALLPSGCSMGDRYGPMIVARRPMKLAELTNIAIAVPGTLTTAYLGLRLLLASLGKSASISPVQNTGPASISPVQNTGPASISPVQNTGPASISPVQNTGSGPPTHEVVPFDRIIDVVAAGQYDAGLIIHEGQLTFQNQGLHLVVDLGVWWQERTGLPLPLGGNVVRRDLGPEVVGRISRLLKESIQYALGHRQDALTYALEYARDMDRALADRFVGMYVNDWTLDYGRRGREAVRRLLDEGHKAGVIPAPVAVEFVE